MRIGLVGVGHLGKIHLACLKDSPFQVAGFFDTDPQMSEKVARESGIKAYDSISTLLSEVDCIDIVSPTVTHYAVAKEAILQGKHVFVEKPLTETVAQAAELVSLAREYKSVVQVGHVERYNPAFRSLTGIQLNPKFIEAHRLAMFNGRGTDVSVVLDLMIHDLDIVLHLIRDEVADVRANGVSIVSPTPDICNARIEFRGGAVANLTASRISMKTMRKIRIFQGDAYIGLDLLEKQAQIIRISEGEQESDAMTLHTAQGIRQLTIESPPIMQQNAILEELTDFYYSISEGRKVSVSIEDGYKALSLAHVIQNQIL